MRTIRIEQIPAELTWPVRHVVMYPDAPVASVKLDNDTEGVHFGLYAADQLCSVISLFQEGDVQQFRKFATLVSVQGKGYGTLLIKHLIDYSKTTGTGKLWCNARISACNFYGKFGFIPSGPAFTNGQINYVIMKNY